VSCPAGHVICYVSCVGVMCRVSYVILVCVSLWHLSCVMCHMSGVICHGVMYSHVMCHGHVCQAVRCHVSCFLYRVSWSCVMCQVVIMWSYDQVIMVVLCHVSCVRVMVMCHVSCVMCHVSWSVVCTFMCHIVVCPMPCVMSHVVTRVMCHVSCPCVTLSCGVTQCGVSCHFFMCQVMWSYDPISLQVCCCRVMGGSQVMCHVSYGIM
jgi:hypothetical protein